MKVYPGVVAALAMSFVVFVGCNAESHSDRTAVEVEPADQERLVRADDKVEQRQERDSIAQNESQQGGDGVAISDQTVKDLRKVCRDIEEPTSRATRHTDGWEKYKDNVKLTVKDFRLYSPYFKKWTLQKIDNPDKSGKVRHGGPYYGFGLTVEVENTGDEVLSGDNVYVWATFKSKTGERVCFGDAEANRSWNPFAKKGVGAWSKEKEYSEWPLRPQETKRYTVSRGSCFSSLFIETELTDVEVEVYSRFRPLGGDMVIAGPLKTFKRKGNLLRGVPLAGSAAIQRVKTKKGDIPARALYAAGDHVLVVGDKKSGWLPIASLAGVGPDSPLETDELPSKTKDYDKTTGALTLKIDGWKVESWRKYNGKLKQGHKMLSANVSISVDTSSVTAQLEASVAAAQTLQTNASVDLTTKETGLTVALASATAAAGTDGEAAAKAAIKAAKADIKTAKKALKNADKGLKGAQKAMGGGISKFLKEQIKAVGCGSFKVDVGRGKLKMHKDSTLNKKTCKPLASGESVTGRVRFDLQRWDLPFVLSWVGTGKALQTHRIASGNLAKILKD